MKNQIRADFELVFEPPLAECFRLTTYQLVVFVNLRISLLAQWA